MLRLIFISFLLVSVFSIGFPVDNPISNFTYVVLRRFGLDVAMTPITYDMSIMTDDENEVIYQNPLDIVVVTRSDERMILNDLDFYRHKIPLILYFEILGYGGSLPEGKVFLCRSLGEVVKSQLSGFMLKLRRTREIRKGFNEFQACP